MTHKTRLLILSFALTFLLLACQLTGVPTSGTPTIADTALTPTATLEPNTYYNPDYGVRVPYPRGWNTQTDQNALIDFISPDGSVYADLYAFPLESGVNLQAVAGQLRDSTLQGLEEITLLEDSVTQLDNGTPAWMTVATAKRPLDSTELKIGMLTTIYGSHIYFLMAFGTTSAYDYYTDDLHNLAYDVQFETTIINGVPRDQALFLSGSESTNPRDYDPATTHGGGDKLVFSGLVSFDPQLNLVPELAESWDVSPDGMVYTFHLRTNARFHDGRPVTAQDFIYSWERAADPATQSDTVLTYLGDIVGVHEMNGGEANHISGLKALDDTTLQVTIDAPKPYFLLKLTYPTAFVLDRANVESGTEWYRTPNGTGTYKLIRWDRFQVMVYERNEDYYLGAPAIPYIVVELYSGEGIRLYESGEIDMTGVSPSNVPRVLDPTDPLQADLHSNVDLCTRYVIFDVTQPPFDDVKVRQAFTMAFDRQKYIDVVYNGAEIPAEGLYPPALPGYNPDLRGMLYDPAQARQFLAQSKYGGPQGLPPIVFTNSGIGNGAGASVAAMVQMWEQNLRVKITIENLEPDKYYDLLYSGHHGQLIESGWCADYPDPENFADALFHSGAQQNLGNYNNPILDAILDQARIEQDVEKRIQFYQKAEQIIVDDAPALFILHSVSYVLVKPYVKGYTLTPIDIPLERYLWLER